MYDGKNCHLHGILDIYNRHLVFPEYFKQRVMFVSSYEKQRHLKRLKKYENRGFKVLIPLQYSIYENEIDHIEGDQILPISQVVEIIAKKRKLL
jgi:hypothetical protein